MYSGMISTHSSSRRLRHRDTTQSSAACRQIQGQHNRLLTQGIIKNREKPFQSFPRRLISYIKEAWSGITTEEGKA